MPHLSVERDLWKTRAHRKTGEPAGSFLTVDVHQEQDGEPEPKRPPGHFMEEAHADATARFLAEVKRLAARRRRRDEAEGWTKPPDAPPR